MATNYMNDIDIPLSKRLQLYQLQETDQIKSSLNKGKYLNNTQNVKLLIFMSYFVNTYCK